jgi:hypothetical protein
MRILIIAILLFAFTGVRSQTIINTVPVKSYTADSIQRHKWFFTSYAGMATGVTFQKGIGSSYLLAPFSLQLNKALTNNVYAFANVTAAPVFSGFNYFDAGMNKMYNNSPYRKFGAYSSASLGLMYVNDAKTFSISGRVGVERGNSLFLFYNGGSYLPVNMKPLQR